MKCVRGSLLFLFVLCTLDGTSYASSDLLDLPYDQTFVGDDAIYFQQRMPIPNIQPASFSGANTSLDMGFLHKYLGYGTLLLTGVAGLTGSESSAHHYSAVGAATLGVMTLASGYYEYGDMFELDEGFSTYNLHIALGTLGAIGFATEAIIAGTGSNHGGLGLGSAAIMGAALIVIVW